MTSFIQLIKLLISGNSLKGIKFRTNLSIILTLIVIIVEIVVYCIYWNSIPNLIKYNYDFLGIPNSVCDKRWIWVNLILQIFICFFVFTIKSLLYKRKSIHNIVYDNNNNIIPIIDKRFSMFAWEAAMLFVTTEQGYIFTLIDIVKNKTCDDIVTLVFLFWLIILIFELRSDLKILKSKNYKKEA